LIIDDEIKTLTIAHYIDAFKKEGVRINRTPGYYVHRVDEMIRGDVSIHQVPFPHVLRIVMIMEYDFDNGQNKDALARQVLGDYYEQNKQRLGL